MKPPVEPKCRTPFDTSVPKMNVNGVASTSNHESVPMIVTSSLLLNEPE